ncbi:MAG: hypothetical protein H6Q41_469, partial [Deltaproteobacteria bacterium]|nr:hypothetical protein [Deltaproteobacteria bacterium]
MGVSCCNDGSIVDLRQTLPLESIYDKWSGRADLNGRPPAPKAGALTRLRYAPMSWIKISK